MSDIEVELDLAESLVSLNLQGGSVSSKVKKVKSAPPPPPSISVMAMQNSDVTSLTGMLPEFRPGDNLSTFLTAVDNLANFLDKNLNPPQIFMFNLAVLSKIKDGARDYLNFHNKTEWPGIRCALLQKYGDQRNEEILLSELRNTVQRRNETYSEYYDRIILAQNDLMQYVQLHELDENIQIFKRSFYQKQALQIFCAGINDPYHEYLMHFELTSLEDALNKCKVYDNKMQEHNYMRFLKQVQNKPNNNRQLPNRPQTRLPINNFEPNFTQNAIQPSCSNQIQFARHYPTTSSNQNMFQKSVTSKQPVRNLNKPIIQNARFNPPQNRQISLQNRAPEMYGHRSTPMSVQSIAPSKQKANNIFQSQSQPTFVTQELFNNETLCDFVDCTEPDDNELQAAEYVEETENFRLVASEDQSST